MFILKGNSKMFNDLEIYVCVGIYLAFKGAVSEHLLSKIKNKLVFPSPKLQWFTVGVGN